VTLRFAFLAVAVVILASVALSRTPDDSSAVHKLYLEDQRDRGVGGPSVESNEMFQGDAARRQQVHAMLDGGTLESAQDFHDAAFIYQHGQTPDDYLLAHVLGTVAVAKGDSTSLWISAAALDRYLDSIHQPQVFGTQYHSMGRSPVTQEPFDRELIPDQLRAVYCVPAITQQKENLAEFNAGKYPAGILPEGCTR
jgi:hypothetical protein